MATVRPEFRVDVYVPKVGDVTFSGPPCVVSGCARPRQQGSGLCRAHHSRWQDSFQHLSPATFAATTSPHIRGCGPLGGCAAPGCRRSLVGSGLCAKHYKRWQNAGRPELSGWISTFPADATPPTLPTCRLPFCDLSVETERQPFCRTHLSRWRDWRRRTGGQDLEAFVAYCEIRGTDRFDFRPLPAQLKLEFQYALQCRVDERRGKMRPQDASRVLRLMIASGTTSLLDWPLTVWEAKLRAFIRGQRLKTIPGARVFLRYAWQRVDDLACGHGWEAEYPRDIWDLRRLGFTDGPRHLRFDRIPQPWLRVLAKRWIRRKLSSKTTPGQAHRLLGTLTLFAKFLAEPTVDVNELAGLSREVLERYAAHALSQPVSTRMHSGYIGAVNAFLMAIRQHRWDATLPVDAAFYPEDFPEPAKLLPRALSEFVMAQIERPDNLARLADPTMRLTTLILIGTGLRIGDATRLPFDCIVHDGQGAPYLRYYNHKMNREGLVPIDEDLLAAIRDQQQWVLERWPHAPVLLPGKTKNPDGARPVPLTTYRKHLHQWLAGCDVRDQPGASGKRVHVTPHQFRHTLGTRLVNKDVPLQVVRVILDHESLAMSGHYARLNDETVRRHWERARKVNCEGEDVKIEPDSPLADAQWVKHRVGLAKQALPNGYCGLPIQKACPHANACLVCPVFVTTPDFLDQHREHREQTRRLLETATDKGQLRMVEMNQQVLTNLDRTIAKLEAGEDPQADLDASLKGVTDAG
jgi:integrase